MMQCPEERNTLIYDVIFSEFHQKGYSSPQVTQLNFDKNNVTNCKRLKQSWKNGNFKIDFS